MTYTPYAGSQRPLEEAVVHLPPEPVIREIGQQWRPDAASVRAGPGERYRPGRGFSPPSEPIGPAYEEAVRHAFLGAVIRNVKLSRR